jgi:NADH-quinone oxidoreductase subunit L
VTVPLIALAIPSVIIGAIFIKPMIFEHFFGDAIFVLPQHNVLEELPKMNWLHMGLHAFTGLPVYIAAAGVVIAWFLYMKRPELPAAIQARTQWLYEVLVQKYFMDHFYIKLIAPIGRWFGSLLWQWGDVKIIDGTLVNGSANTVGVVARIVRHVQSGYLYHYAFAMILGLMVLIGAFTFGWIKI